MAMHITSREEKIHIAKTTGIFIPFAISFLVISILGVGLAASGTGPNYLAGLLPGVGIGFLFVGMGLSIAYATFCKPQRQPHIRRTKPQE